MFAVGMSPAANSFFVTSTLLVAVPTGIKIFNWLGTMWGGKIRFATPMLFCVGLPLPVPLSPASPGSCWRWRRSTGS